MFFKALASKPAGISFLRWAYHEKPDLVIGTGIIFLSIGLCAIDLMRYDYFKETQYKYHYTVIRDDDPKASDARRQPYLN